MKNKEETKRKLIAAVAHVFREQSYSKLGVNHVARIAGVNKKLIYRYFGSFDRLVEAYVIETDFWMLFSDQINQLSLPKELDETKMLVGQLLKNQFRQFFSSKEMQELILWEIGSHSPLMQSIHRTRESMGRKIFELTDVHLSHEKINFRAVAALMVGGIYYMILHSRINGSTFSDVELRNEHGREEILTAIDQLLDLIFDAQHK